jgi:CRISPR/Cas system CMR-associated protein Cmr1 (group 7 of RAMP superfamily)
LETFSSEVILSTKTTSEFKKFKILILKERPRKKKQPT